MNDWMATTISNNRRLADILIPGSHDACMYMMTNKNGQPKDPSSKVITQYLSIYEQLQSGTRFFDIRIYRNKSGALHAGHFAEQKGKGKADMGDFGPSLTDVLEQVGDFMNEDPGRNETVILKFSHVHSSNREGVIQEVVNVLGNKLYRKKRDLTVGSERMHALRGKVIAIYESGFVGKMLQANTVVNFENKKSKRRFEPSQNKEGRFILRGEFSNKRHLSEIYKIQQGHMQAWNNIYREPAYRGEMMQLYWTATWHVGSNPLKMSVAKNTEPLWKPAGKNQLRGLISRYHPNIVMVDFADEDKNSYILDSA
jgi:hypothetical protein